MLDWARQQRVERFDFGASRAQTANGVFNFKRQWGTRVATDKGQHARWYFFGQRLAASLCEQLSAAGLITEVNGRLYRLVLRPQAGSNDSENLARLLREAEACGLAGIVTISAEGNKGVMPVPTVVTV